MKRTDAHHFHELTPFIKPELPKAIWASFFMLIQAAATGLYAYLIGPVVKFFFTGGFEKGDSLAMLLDKVGLTPSYAETSYALKVLPLLVFFAALLKASSRFALMRIMGGAAERIGRRLRETLFERLHVLNPSVFQKRQTGDIAQRLQSDITLITEALSSALGALIADSLKILVLLTLAITLDWRLALFSLIVLPVVGGFTFLTSRWIKTAQRNRMDKSAKASSFLIEEIRAYQGVREYQLQKERAERFRTINNQQMLAAIGAIAKKAMSSPTMELLGAVGLALTLFLAGLRLENDSLVAEHFISFFAAILLMYEPLKNIGRLNGVWQSGMAGLERSFSLFDWEEEQDTGTLTPKKISGEFHFEACRIAYDHRGDILYLDNLTISSGELVGIVGISGAGKTTFANCLTRFIEPISGAIFLDKEPLTNYKLSSLRKHIAVVSQTPFLLSDTIYENIRFGDLSASEKAIHDAAAKARLTPLLSRLPNGIHERLTNGGDELSSGEKARIAIARAFLKDAPILILDEITAALDRDNERLIIQGIEDLARNRTVFLIAHRLHLLENATRILVLADGRIAEEGTHESLIAQNGHYAHLYQRKD